MTQIKTKHPKIEVGDKFKTTYYGFVTVTEYINACDVRVVFEDGTPHKVHAVALRRSNVGHPKCGVPEGFEFTNKDGVKGTVYKFHNTCCVDVEWEDGVITHGHSSMAIRSGSLYYPNFKSVVGVGYFGIGDYLPNKSGRTGNYNRRIYRSW